MLPEPYIVLSQTIDAIFEKVLKPFTHEAKLNKSFFYE